MSPSGVGEAAENGGRGDDGDLGRGECCDDSLGR